MLKDEYVIALDFFAHGKAGDRKAEPIIQAIGEKFLNLLEIAVKENESVSPGERLYIGAEKREKVKYIRGRISYDELTAFAKNELENIVLNLIEKNEKRFVNVFNKAGPITTRMHSLELLPGIGKKHCWQIIQERRKKAFESFEDLQKRVKMLPDPKRMIKKRIIEELRGVDRYKLFVGTNFF